MLLTALLLLAMSFPPGVASMGRASAQSGATRTSGADEFHAAGSKLSYPSRGVAIVGDGHIPHLPKEAGTVSGARVTHGVSPSAFTSSLMLGTAPRDAEAGPVPYTSFYGETLSLYPHRGRHVALLVPSAELDSATLGDIVAVFDGIYEYYWRSTGREPAPFYIFEGLATVAAVPSTCGAGCAYLGYTGIELAEATFNLLYEGVLNEGAYDQTIFYEFGRNFWFYEDQVGYKPPDNPAIATGYAVFMRFMAMEATAVTPAPYHGTPFSVFQAEVEGMLDRYLADETLTWHNTLRIDKGPNNPMGLGGADLFAAFLFELCDMYGDPFVDAFWRRVGERRNAETTQGAVDNFILAASMAAGENLSDLFVSTWRWPMSEAAREEADELFSHRPVYLPLALGEA